MKVSLRATQWVQVGPTVSSFQRTSSRGRHPPDPRADVATDSLSSLDSDARSYPVCRVATDSLSSLDTAVHPEGCTSPPWRPGSRPPLRKSQSVRRGVGRTVAVVSTGWLPSPGHRPLARPVRPRTPGTGGRCLVRGGRYHRPRQVSRTTASTDGFLTRWTVVGTNPCSHAAVTGSTTACTVGLALVTHTRSILSRTILSRVTVSPDGGVLFREAVR